MGILGQGVLRDQKLRPLRNRGIGDQCSRREGHAALVKGRRAPLCHSNFPKNHLSCKSQGHEKKKRGSSGQVRKLQKDSRRWKSAGETSYSAQGGIHSTGTVSWIGRRIMEPEKPLVGRINVGHGTQHVLLNCVLWARDDTGRWCKGSGRFVAILGWMGGTGAESELGEEGHTAAPVSFSLLIRTCTRINPRPTQPHHPRPSLSHRLLSGPIFPPESDQLHADARNEERCGCVRVWFSSELAWN